VDKFASVGRRVLDAVKEVRYDDFSGGDFGNIDAANAPPNTFSASNMIVYRNGMIGPRAGLLPLSYVRGVPDDTGIVKGIGWRGTANVDLWWIVNDAVFYAPSRTVGGTVGLFSGFLDATPGAGVSPQWIEYGNDDTYLTIYGDDLYHMTHEGTPTCTKVTSGKGGRAIAFHGDRLFVAGVSGSLYRVYFSATLDPDDWTGGEFFDVPNASGAIVGMWDQRNHLSILTQNGEWWVVTGAPGTDSAFLRRVTGGGVHPWVACADMGVCIGSDELWHTPILANYPADFNGATVNEKRYLDLQYGTSLTQTGIGTVKALRGFRPDEVVFWFPASQRVGLYVNGVWTMHTIAISGVTLSVHAVSDNQGQIIFTDGGGASAQPKFYTWKIDLDRPANTGDALAKPGDAKTTFNTATLYFPEEWVPDGTEVRVRSVTVDFTKYDTGSASNNSFTVTPRTISRYATPTANVTDATAQSFSEAVTAWTAGVGTAIRDRKVMRFGTEARYGGGFQIRMSGIAGVAIKSVTVEIETRNEVPRI
jgi:hypothetical protein